MQIAKAPPYKWTDELKQILVIACIEEVNIDTSISKAGGFESAGWARILEKYNEKAGDAQATQKQLNRQYRQMRKNFSILMSLRVHRGFGWDEVNKVPTASDEVWNKYLSNLPKDGQKYRRFRTHALPFYDELLVVFSQLIEVQKFDETQTNDEAAAKADVSAGDDAEADSSDSEGEADADSDADADSSEPDPAAATSTDNICAADDADSADSDSDSSDADDSDSDSDSGSDSGSDSDVDSSDAADDSESDTGGGAPAAAIRITPASTSLRALDFKIEDVKRFSIVKRSLCGVPGPAEELVAIGVVNLQDVIPSLVDISGPGLILGLSEVEARVDISGDWAQYGRPEFDSEFLMAFLPQTFQVYEDGLSFRMVRDEKFKAWMQCELPFPPLPDLPPSLPDTPEQEPADVCAEENIFNFCAIAEALPDTPLRSPATPVDARQQSSSLESTGEDEFQFVGSRVWADNFYLRAFRPGQSKFRDEVLARCNNQCVVTGVKLQSVLQAAHIVPYKDKGKLNIGFDIMNAANGIALRADLHILFDNGSLWVSRSNGILTWQCIDEVAEYVSGVRGKCCDDVFGGESLTFLQLSWRERDEVPP